MYFREDQADIRLTITDDANAVPAGLAQLSGLSWKTFSGGDLTADNAKTRPGGMGREVDTGGPASRGDITLETQMTDVVAGWIGALEGTVGTGQASVGVALLKANRASSGSKLGPYTGTVKAVNVPDLGGGNDVGMLTVVISCNELTAAGS